MRVFIAIDIPEELKDNIYNEIKKIRGVRGKFVEKENLHITLKFLGELQPNIVENIKDDLGIIEFQKFEIEVYGLGNFNNRVLWFGIRKGAERIIELKNQIDDILRKHNFPPDRDFHPHVTILRIKEILSRQDYQNTLEKLRNVEIGRFIAGGFSLKQSILRREGPLYLNIKEYQFI